jgi:hypothetical protein
MTTATPTVLPRSKLFPNLLPRAPLAPGCPTPLPPSDHVPHRMNDRRDIWREMEQLSEEEAELEELACSHLPFASIRVLITVNEIEPCRQEPGVQLVCSARQEPYSSGGEERCSCR